MTDPLNPPARPEDIGWPGTSEADLARLFTKDDDEAWAAWAPWLDGGHPGDQQHTPRPR